MGPMELGHVFEIHPVYGGQKGQGYENDRNHGQGLDYLVQPMALDAEEQVDLTLLFMDIRIDVIDQPIDLLLELTEIFGLEPPDLHPLQFKGNIP